MAAAIRLSEDPGRFFGANEWHKIVRSAGTKQNALELLDAAHPEESTDWWDCALPKMSKQDRSRLFERGRALRSEFQRNLISGKYVAFGFFNGQSNRVLVPPDRLPELWPRFATERLVGRDLQYTEILVVEAEKMESPAEEFQQRLTDWVKARRAENMRLRKILEPAAREHFGQQFTKRAFDIAYKIVFNSRRGHPPKGL